MHKMKEVCRGISHKMDESIVIKHQVDETKLLITFIHTCKYFAILSSQHQTLAVDFSLNL